MVIKWVADVLAITKEDFMTVYVAQKLPMAEKHRVPKNWALTFETEERNSILHIYVNIAVLNYSTSFAGALGVSIAECSMDISQTVS